MQGTRSSEREGAGLRIQLLGGFQVWAGSLPIPSAAWRRRKAAALVKLLALAPEHRLHREEVLEGLWPEFPPNAGDNNLHRTLHIARHVLEPDLAPGRTSLYLCLEGDAVVLCPQGPLQVDVDAFLTAARAARGSRDTAPVQAALALYGGDLLPEDQYEDWAAVRGEELRRLYHQLLRQLSRLYAERGEYAQAIEGLQRLLDREPEEEEAHAELMRLYALAGQRHEALRQYERLSEILEREVDAEPDAPTRQLYQQIKAGEIPPAASRPTHGHRSEEDRASGQSAAMWGASQNQGAVGSPTNLPRHLSSFVGREEDIAEVARLLASRRLLTLTGAGGVGKSRLALRVAEGVREAYGDGVWLVQLAALADPSLVPRAVAAALGLREGADRALREVLTEFLGVRRALLILDNCEHLLHACAQLAETLLGRCPRLQILATGRRALGLPNERVWRVPSLAAPDRAGSLALHSLVSFDAIALFLERTRSVRPAFELTSTNAPAVVEVCRRLEGIPLAIELAAARMKVLTVEQLAERLDNCFAALGGGSTSPLSRHRTLRAALDWSSGLLSEGEGLLFRRLAVFAGGWTLEAAEEVCSEEGIEMDEVLDLLSGLADSSLVIVTKQGSAMRYRLLEPIRQYALGKLQEAGEADRVRRRHRDWYGALAAGIERELTGPGQVEGLERLEWEHDNLRAALRWSLHEGRTADALQLAVRLSRFWSRHGHLEEGVAWLEGLLARNGSLPKSLRADALQALAALVQSQRREDRARALCEESLRLRRELGDKPGIARQLNQLGLLAWCRAEYGRAAQLYEEALALFRELGEGNAAAGVLHNLGLVRLYGGNREMAQRLEEESLAFFEGAGDQEGIAWGLYGLGLVALHGDDAGRAAVLLKRSLSLFRELGYTAAIAYALQALAATAATCHEPARAARLSGAARALCAGICAPFPMNEQQMFDHFLASARNEMGESACASAQRDGGNLTLEEAVGEALFVGTRAGPRTVQEGRPVTPREEEVLGLIAQGRTNGQIAADLGMSESTAALHVHHLLKKLGLASRKDVALWVREHGPISAR